MRHNVPPTQNTKSERTRLRVLAIAAKKASSNGIGSLTFGSLAETLEMSKSGIYAHFGSIERLQIDVIEYISQQFWEQVVVPTFSAPKGRARLKAVMQNWLIWSVHADRPGGCQLLAANFENDLLKGPVREYLAGRIETWRGILSGLVNDACQQDRDLSIKPEHAVAFVIGLYTTQHIERLLLGDDMAHERALKLWLAYIG